MTDVSPIVVHSVVSLEPSGPERLVVDLAKGLRFAGWDVRVMAIRNGILRAELEAASVPVTITNPELTLSAAKSRVAASSYGRVRRYIRETGPSIVHTHLLGMDVFAGRAARLEKVPVRVSTQHVMTERGPLSLTVHERALASFDLVIACSVAVLDFCGSVLRVPAERLQVIENGIDVTRFEAASGPFRSPPTFATVGTLAPVKGHAHLFRAFSEVAVANPGVRLLVVGEGPIRHILERWTVEHGLHDSVTFTGPVADVVPVLAQADVLVQPSLSEGLPLALMEALAASKPVIATAVGPVPSLLGDGEYGTLVPPADHGALAEAMNAVAASPKEAVEKARRGAEAVRRRFRIEDTVRAYADAYASLLDLKELREGTAVESVS